MAYRHRQRRLRAERCEARLALATDLGQIAGVVSSDFDDDGTPDGVLSGRTVELIRDDGDGVLDADDQPLLTDTTDSEGAYSFDGLGAGDYFVRLPASVTSPAAVSALIEISETEAMGSPTQTIDDFRASHLVTAFGPDFSFGEPTDGRADRATGTAGGVRDVSVEALTGVGTLQLEAGLAGSSTLRLSSGSDVTGRASIVWDGVDGDAFSVEAESFLIDLSATTHLTLTAASDRADTQLRVRLYSSNGRTSETDVTILDTDGVLDGDPTESLEVDLASLNEGPGGAADLSAITAIELLIDSSEAPGLDAQFGPVEGLGYSTETADLLVVPELGLGDQVWLDSDNNGVFDPGETGLAGVAITLFEDTDLDGFIDDEVSVGATTTDGSGAYSFRGLSPGDYVVRIDASNFLSGGALEGLSSSTGNNVSATAPDADLDSDDGVDRGNPDSNGSVASAPVTLAGPLSTNAIDRIDFGFFGYDLQLAHTVDAQSAAPGDTLSYVTVVSNLGPTPAAGVVVVQTLPSGVTFVPGASGSDAVLSGLDVTFELGQLDVGQAVELTVTVSIDAGTAGQLTSTATVSALDESLIDNNTGSASTLVVPRDGSISGVVYYDLNRNGIRDGALQVTAGAELLFVLDRSGSMEAPFDGVSGVTRLEAAIEGIIAFNRRLIEQGFGDSVSVGLVVFDSAAGALDLDPTLSGVQALINPNADADGDGVLDLNAALASLTAGDTTSFAPALEAALAAFAESDATDASRTVIFLSDGVPDDTPLLPDTVAQVRDAGVSLRAFGVGADASLAGLQVLDPSAAVFEASDALITALGGLVGGDGFIEPALAGWIVYLDLNNDGLRGSDEPFLQTDELGAYAFDALDPRSYTVRQELPSGWETIAPTESRFDVDLLQGGEANDRDFGAALAQAPTIAPVLPPVLPPVVVPPVVAPPPPAVVPVSFPTRVVSTAPPAVFGSSVPINDGVDLAVAGEAIRVESPAYRYGRGIDEVDYDLIFESLIDFQRPDLLPIGLGDEAPEQASESSSESDGTLDAPSDESSLPWSSAETSGDAADTPEPTAQVSEADWIAYGEDLPDPDGTPPTTPGWGLGFLAAAAMSFATRRRVVGLRRLLRSGSRR